MKDDDRKEADPLGYQGGVGIDDASVPGSRPAEDPKTSSRASEDVAYFMNPRFGSVSRVVGEASANSWCDSVSRASSTPWSGSVSLVAEDTAKDPLPLWLSPVRVAACVRRLFKLKVSTFSVLREAPDAVHPRLRGSCGRVAPATAPPARPRPSCTTWYIDLHMPTDWQQWLPFSSPIDGRLTTPAHSVCDEPSPTAGGLESLIASPAPPAVANQTAQYADEEDNARDRYPRRLRGTQPHQRQWWIPGLQAVRDLWSEARSGWKGIIIGMLAVTSMFACMHDGGGGGGNGNIRHLRTWGPEMQSRFPFKRWVREVMLWTVANADLNEFRQAAYVSTRLTGMAREYVDEWPPQILIQGGLINGVQVPPMAFLMHSLTERWGQLGEEERTQAVQALMNFNRHDGERIDDLLTHFDILRNRAQLAGQLVIGFEGLSFLLLRACRVTDVQLQMLLQHYSMIYPHHGSAAHAHDAAAAPHRPHDRACPWRVGHRRSCQ